MFIGSSKQLHRFFEDMNKLHPTLKFTLTHTTPIFEAEEDKCNCERKDAIPFLEEGKKEKLK